MKALQVREQPLQMRLQQNSSISQIHIVRITGHEGLALLMGLGARMYEPKIRVVEQRHRSVLAPDREGAPAMLPVGNCLAGGFAFRVKCAYAGGAAEDEDALEMRPGGTGAGNGCLPNLL